MIYELEPAYPEPNFDTTDTAAAEMLRITEMFIDRLPEFFARLEQHERDLHSRGIDV